LLFSSSPGLPFSRCFALGDGDLDADGLREADLFLVRGLASSSSDRASGVSERARRLTGDLDLDFSRDSDRLLSLPPFISSGSLLLLLLFDLDSRAGERDFSFFTDRDRDLSFLAGDREGDLSFLATGDRERDLSFFTDRDLDLSFLAGDRDRDFDSDRRLFLELFLSRDLLLDRDRERDRLLRLRSRDLDLERDLDLPMLLLDPYAGLPPLQSLLMCPIRPQL